MRYTPFSLPLGVFVSNFDFRELGIVILQNVRIVNIYRGDYRGGVL